MPGSTKKEDGDHRSWYTNPGSIPRSDDRPLSSWWIVAVLIIAAVLLGFLAAWLAPYASAMQPGNVTYFASIVPLHDPFELQVNPGDTLIQGRSYDFTKVLGFNNSFSHWKDYFNQGQDCNPDNVVDVSYINSNGAVNPKNFRIDPDQMPTGDYFEFDGCFNRYVRGQETPTEVPYLNGETVIFTVINYSTDMPIITNWENEQAAEGFTPGAKA